MNPAKATVLLLVFGIAVVLLVIGLLQTGADCSSELQMLAH